MRDDSQLRQLVTDRRARIPFALIGILLLLSAGALVLHAETQTAGTESLDPDRAMERTDAAVQTATRDAVGQATNRAAQQPLTDTAETEYGEILDEYSGSVSGQEDLFEGYLRALIYLQAQETFETAGQQVGAVETDVLLPEVSDADSFREGIDRVELTAGGEDPELESGVLQVSITNVTTVLRRNGNEIDRQTETVTVTVPTPIIQLHERTERFQSRLDAGVTESGFTQRFNARIYALGWARGYAQYYGLPVTEVIANRHVIPSANSAVYRTQQDVFGAADPHLNNAVRRGWLCMAMQDAEGLYNGYNRTGAVEYADDLCDASRWLFGDRATGELPESPGVTDLIGEAPGMDKERTLGVNETAYLPLRKLVSSAGEHSIENAVDRIYEIESRLDVSVSDISRPEFDHDPPELYGPGSGSHLSTTNEETTVSVTAVSENTETEQYYTITGEVTIRLEEKREHTSRSGERIYSTTTSDTGTLAGEFEMRLGESETAPDANIDAYQSRHGGAVDVVPEHRYEPGPDRVSGGTDPTVPGGSRPGGFRNYEGAEAEILTAFAGGTNHSEVEAWLENRWNTTTTASGLAADEKRTVSINQSLLSDGLLKATIVRDIRKVQSDISDVSVQFERREIVHDGDETGPYGKLLREVRAEKASSLERDQPYQNVGQKTVYEVRHAYFESLESDLERLESANDEAMEALDDELGDLGLGSALTYLQEGVTATPPDPVPLESSSLTSNISYEVSGSPTYLVAENVTTLDVPAVKNDVDAFAPLAARNRNYLKLPYRSVIEGLLSRFAKLFGFGDPDAKLTLRMAGEALQAGELAEDAARTDEEREYADHRSLKGKTDGLKRSVDSAIGQFQTSVRKQIQIHLYPGDVQLPCTEPICSEMGAKLIQKELGEDVSCSRHSCEYHIEKNEVCMQVRCRMKENSTGKESRERIADAASRAVENAGESTASRAIAIDDGNVTEPLVAALQDELDEPRYRPAYARSATDEQWQAYLRSAVQPAVTRGVNSGDVTVGDTETIENLDTEIRQALESVSRDVVEERLDRHLDGESFSIEEYDDWVDGVNKPMRVPAGMPLLPLPTHWYATVNAWDVEVNGEYARFEVTANMGSPETGGTTTYVRESQPVSLEIEGEPRTVGTVEPIEFSGRSGLVVVVPPGGIGVGDRDDEDPECSPTWPVTGAFGDKKSDCR